VNANLLTARQRLVPRAEYEGAKRPNDDQGAQLGTPYAVGREMLFSRLGGPCNDPPWGELSAIGGPLVTKSGLVFIGAATGSAFRAFDLATGEELWRTRLRAGASATPMSYRVEDAEGGPRQFVVVAAGGHWGFHSDAGADLGDALMAFALPRE
jgi:quinoprotein glucose dehydrogenase